jgi:hypothetical protein
MVCLSLPLPRYSSIQNGGKFRNSLTPFTAQAYGLIYLIGIADGELTVSGSYIRVARAERVPPLI